MKPLILLTLTLSIFFGAVTPSLTYAESESYDSFYQAGEPTITDGTLTSGGFVPCSGAECSLCHFAVLANTIIKWLIGIIFLFFAVLAVYAGFKLVTSGGNPAAKQAAKSSFTNAFIGLFIILAAWILIDTLLRFVLKGGNGEVNGYGPWAEIECATQATPGIEVLGITDEDFNPEIIIRSTASGDSRSTMTGTAIDQRVAGIAATPDVTRMSDEALNRAGITDPAQRNAYRALISQESSNCAKKVGPTTRWGTAYGCTQMLIGTAREVDARLNNRFKGKTDAQVAAMLQNDNAYAIQLGAQYYKQGLQKYGSIESALARYNGGDGALKQSITCPGQLVYQCQANSGYAETRNYVANIQAVAAKL